MTTDYGQAAVMGHSRASGSRYDGTTVRRAVVGGAVQNADNTQHSRLSSIVYDTADGLLRRVVPRHIVIAIVGS